MEGVGMSVMTDGLSSEEVDEIVRREKLKERAEVAASKLKLMSLLIGSSEGNVFMADGVELGFAEILDECADVMDELRKLPSY